MKKLFILFLILFLPLIGNATTMLINGDGTSAAGGDNGFVGNKAAVVDSVFQTDNHELCHSHFVASASGTVSAICVRRYDAGTNMTLVCPAIWNADGSTQLAKASDCTSSNPATNLYRYVLASAITVTASTTYTLGYAYGGGAQYCPYSDTGAIYIETGTLYTIAQCPSSPATTITHDATFTTAGALTIWATNTADCSD